MATCKDCLFHKDCKMVENYCVEITEDGAEYDCDQFLDSNKYAEAVHGYWIDSYTVDHMGRITEHGIDCSVCDSVFKADRRDVVQHWKEQFKVCPFCGAVMDGGNEDA